MDSQVQISRATHVCEVRLNRPEKRNAITFAMYEALCEALQAAQADTGVRVLLLSGEGPGFCAGNDLQDFLAGPEFTMQHPVLKLLRLLVTFDKPLLAAVHGQAVGIGATVLLHFDLVVAAHSARLSMPFVALGLVPEAGSSLLLPLLLGRQRAAELLLLGTPCDAATALSFGLVSRVVEEPVLLSEARALAATLAQQPPEALAATRRLLRGDVTAILARIDDEARVFATQLKSPEFQTRIRALLAKSRAG